MYLVYQPGVYQYKQGKLETRRRPHARAHAPNHILTSVGHPTNNRSDPTDNTPSEGPARLADLRKIARRRSLDQSPSSS